MKLRSSLRSLVSFSHGKAFIRFCIVGGISAIINYACFIFVFLLLQWHYAIASVSGYIPGIVASFFMNRVFTFNTTRKVTSAQILKYFAVYAFSIPLGIAFLIFEVEILGLHPLLANAIMILLSAIINYVGVRLLVFSD